MSDIDLFKTIDLTASRVLCNFHPLPWKETWQEAGTIVAVTKFTIALFDVLVNDEEFQDKCGAQAEAINANMPIPLCCWVHKNYPEKLQQAYAELGVDPPSVAEIARRN